MNNLLFLALLLIISIVIVVYFTNAEKEAMLPFNVIDGNAMAKERCEKYNKMKIKMNSPSCGIDNRCDYIKIGVKDEMTMDKNGNLKIEETKINNCEPSAKASINLEKNLKDLITAPGFKIEQMSNMGEEAVEQQIKYCKDPKRTCDDMGPNCGYCDDNFNQDGLGRVMWTNRGAKGSGSESVLGGVSDPDGKPCPKNMWFYGDKELCKKKRRQRMCKQIKSCDDFEKYADKIPDDVCGFCPTLGKAVPIKKIDDRNVPLYEPEDSCFGGPELAKYGTLNAKQCRKFMTDNPCVRPQYWTGVPDHSPECYKKLYKNAGGRDSKKNASWWSSSDNREKYNIGRSQLNAPETNGMSGLAPVPWINTEFKKLAEQITNKCYGKANNAWNWLTGYKYNPCVHQDETGYGNRECQRTREGEISGMTQTGTVSDYQNYYNNPHCEGFVGSKEGFFNLTDWLKQNNPAMLRNREADKWYNETKDRAPDKFARGGEDYKKYLREIQNVMHSGKTYEMRVRATRLLRGFGQEPPPPPQIKVGDYVEYIAKEHIYRGVIYRLKTIDGLEKALVMWDYYMNTKTNSSKVRGPSMGVCLKDINGEPHSEGDCIEGISANLIKDEETCNKKTGTKKASCLIPKNTPVMSRGRQRYSFGWPQFPSIKASIPNNPLGNDKMGWIDTGNLTILRHCKKSSEGCSPTDYNCEASIEAVNKLYKKPQDCSYTLSNYSNCSANCDGGWQYKDFKIHFPSKGQDAMKCPYGNNQKGYQSKVEWRRCNTEPCHPDKFRKVRLRWCKNGENDPNCVGANSAIGKGGTCYSVGNVDFMKHERRKGDMMTAASCKNGGGYWDSGGELSNKGAHFALLPAYPTQNNPSVYKFVWIAGNKFSDWMSLNKTKRKAGIRKSYHGLCLHPNVNSVEIGGQGQVVWGRGDGYRMGPTHARNNDISSEKFCPWKPNRNFGEIYGSWIRWNRYGLKVTRIAKDSDNNYIAFVNDGRYGKMCKFRPTGSYIWNSGRYVNSRTPPGCASDLISWYRRGRYAASGYRFRKKSGFRCDKKTNENLSATFYKHCNYGGWKKCLGVGRYNWVGAVGIRNDDMSSLKVPKGLKVTLYQHSNFRGSRRVFDAKNRNLNISCLVNYGFNDVVSSIVIEKSGGGNNSGNEWNGLGRLGSCNDKHANFKLIKTDKGDKFRLQREAFTGGYSVDKVGNVKEGYHWNRGSRKRQIPGKGFYMGMQPNRWNWSTSDSRWDRLYGSESGTVHKFDCDYNNYTAEKRVGLFTCQGGSKNGKKFPFKTTAAFCGHIDPLREAGYQDSQLICKEGCEPYGGTCEGPIPGLVYHIEKARPWNTQVYAKNSRWRWAQGKSILANDDNPTGKVIGGTINNWYNRAREIPSIKTRSLKVKYYGKDQGWGNPTSWVRLVLWSGRNVIYNKDVGGRNCWRSGNCVSRGWKWNTQEIPYTEFTTKKEEVITKAIIVVREMGSGHRAWLKNASIEFNPNSKF